MHHIFVEHKKKLIAEKRAQRVRASTPPNQNQNGPHFFAEDRHQDADLAEVSNNQLLQNNGQMVGPEFDTQTQQEEFMVEEATKGLCDGFNLQSCVLLIALSMHSVFEGIALGLTKETSATINIMVALLLHKPAAAISLGVSISKNFVQKNEEKKGIFLLCIFAAATPLGILIGMALQHTSDMVEVIFNSFAGGTFLYIAASEVIVEEFSLPDRYKWT